MKIYPMTNITIIAVNMLKILAFTLACTFIVPEVFIHFFCNFCLRAIILLKKCVYLHKIRVDETVCYMSIVFVYSCADVPAGFMLVSLYIYEYYLFYPHPASGFFFRFLRVFFCFCAFCPLSWTFCTKDLACFSCIFS